MSTQKDRTRHSSQAGLTLIEVLVAFAILAGLVVSILALIGQNAQYMLTAEERLLASVAADNLLTNDLAILETPSPGEEAGVITVSDREFGFLRITRELGEETVIIEYRVSSSIDGQTLARASALKERT